MLTFKKQIWCLVCHSILELHYTCSQWTTATAIDDSTFGDQRLVNYLSSIEKQYQSILDHVNNHTAVSVCVNMYTYQLIVHKYTFN